MINSLNPKFNLTLLLKILPFFKRSWKNRIKFFKWPSSLGKGHWEVFILSLLLPHWKSLPQSFNRYCFSLHWNVFCKHFHVKVFFVLLYFSRAQHQGSLLWWSQLLWAADALIWVADEGGMNKNFPAFSLYSYSKNEDLSGNSGSVAQPHVFA